MPVPVKLNFRPSQRKKEHHLVWVPGDKTSRSDRLPGQRLKLYLDSAINTNLYPSLSLLTTVAPYSDLQSEDDEADMARELLPQDPNARPSCFENLFEEYIFVFAIMMATSATTFIQGVIVINTATIGGSLEMTAAQMTWIAAAIGLGSGSFMLFFGKTADLFGRKNQLLGGMAFLSLLSLITSFAPNPMAMNVLCGFLGLGTAVISPPAIGMLFATYPEGRRRNRAAGALGSGNPLGFIMGSMSSGLATKAWSWRASFIVVAIFFFVMTLLAFWTMPIIRRSGSVKTEIKRFDWLGAIMAVMGMALFCAALTEGPVRGWKSHSVIIMIILGFLLLFSFAFWEHFYKFPLLDPSVWSNKNYTLCVLCTLFGYMSFITNQFWISLYMQQVQGFSSITVAVRMLPQAIAGIAWSFVGQALVHRISGTILMGIGALAYLLGATLQIFIRQNTPYWKLLFPALLITVLGADFQFIVSNLYVSKQMPLQSSLAAGVLQTAMRLSVSLGLSITAAIYGSTLANPRAISDITYAYDRAYLCSILFAVIGCLFVPFLRIGKQGGTAVEKGFGNEKGGVVEERGYRDEETQTFGDNLASSTPSFQTQGTWGSASSNGSIFPRHSWERQNFQAEGHVVYEVCVKCLKERKVVYGRRENSYPIDGFEEMALRGGDLGSRTGTGDVRVSMSDERASVGRHRDEWV